MLVVEGSDIRFVQLRRSQGLSQEPVTSALQGNRGFLWFGTQFGLNRYDGYHFRVFKNDPADPTSSCGVFISSLFIDLAGSLWVGCDYTLDRYDPRTETFIHCRLHKSTGISISARRISQERSGILWLGNS